MMRKEVGFVVTDDYKTWIEEVKKRLEIVRLRLLLELIMRCSIYIGILVLRDM